MLLVFIRLKTLSCKGPAFDILFIIDYGYVLLLLTKLNRGASTFDKIESRCFYIFPNWMHESIQQTNTSYVNLDYAFYRTSFIVSIQIILVRHLNTPL